MSGTFLAWCVVGLVFALASFVAWALVDAGKQADAEFDDSEDLL